MDEWEKSIFPRHLEILKPYTNNMKNEKAVVRTQMCIRDRISANSYKPANGYALKNTESIVWSFHHTALLIIALLIIFVLRKQMNLNFYFQLGDKKKGIKYLSIFTATIALIRCV